MTATYLPRKSVPSHAGWATAIVGPQPRGRHPAWVTLATRVDCTQTLRSHGGSATRWTDWSRASQRQGFRAESIRALSPRRNPALHCCGFGESVCHLLSPDGPVIGHLQLSFISAASEVQALALPVSASSQGLQVHGDVCLTQTAEPRSLQLRAPPHTPQSALGVGMSSFLSLSSSTGSSSGGAGWPQHVAEQHGHSTMPMWGGLVTHLTREPFPWG